MKRINNQNTHVLLVINGFFGIPTTAKTRAPSRQAQMHVIWDSRGHFIWHTHGHVIWDSQWRTIEPNGRHTEVCELHYNSIPMPTGERRCL
jgi:hypothetical protein